MIQGPTNKNMTFYSNFIGVIDWKIGSQQEKVLFRH